MKTKSGLTVQNVSFLGGAARAEGNKLSIDTNVCLVLPIVAGNAFESACVAAVHSAVASVLDRCTNSKVFAAIVKRIMVYMIALTLIAMLQAQDFAVHLEGYALAGFSYIMNCIKTSGARSKRGVPFAPIQPFKVDGVNDGYLASSKLNNAIFFIWGGHGRLLNSLKCMSAETLTAPVYQGVCHE